MENYQIILLTILLIMFFFSVVKLLKNHFIKITNKNILSLEELIEKLEWDNYRYKFIKKLIYVEYYYRIKYNTKEDLTSVLREHPLYKENVGLTYYTIFGDEKSYKIIQIIEENKDFFETLFDNDVNMVNYNEIMSELLESLNELKKYRIYLQG
jgi:hypothetical protein